MYNYRTHELSHKILFCHVHYKIFKTYILIFLFVDSFQNNMSPCQLKFKYMSTFLQSPRKLLLFKTCREKSINYTRWSMLQSFSSIVLYKSKCFCKTRKYARFKNSNGNGLPVEKRRETRVRNDYENCGRIWAWSILSHPGYPWRHSV